MSEGIDRLSALFERFKVHAHLFHNGPLCGVSRFAAEPGRGFLHVMRQGSMVVTHRAKSGAPRKITVTEPTLLFYPRPLAHDFHNAPQEGSEFTCATLDFEGGDAHPLVRALPAVVVLPLSEVGGLNETLTLLFAETAHVRCGQRLLADRLFEVLLLQLVRWMLDRPEVTGLKSGLLLGLAEPRLARALTGMHEQPGESWSLERMAHCAGMSRSAFAELFRREIGETPAEYLAHWRLAIAQTKLRAGKPLKVIANELGYATAPALSRLFTQKVGCSPREWLKLQGAGDSDV